MYHLRNEADVTASQPHHTGKQFQPHRNGTYHADDASHDTDHTHRTTGSVSQHRQPTATHGNTRLVSTAANLEYARRVEMERYERRASGDISDDVIETLVDRSRIADEVLRDLASMPNAAGDWQTIREHRAASQQQARAAQKRTNGNDADYRRQTRQAQQHQCTQQQNQTNAQQRNQARSADGDAFAAFDQHNMSQKRPVTKCNKSPRRKDVSTSHTQHQQRHNSAPNANASDAVKQSQQHVAAHNHSTATPSDQHRINSMPSLNVETNIKARRRRIGIRTTQIAASVGVACVLGLGMFNAYASQQAKAASGVDIAGVIASMPTDDDGHVETMGDGTLMQASYRTGNDNPLVSDVVGEDGSVAASIGDIAELRSSAVGMADSAVEELGDYVDADALRDAESRMTGATSVDAFDAARADFDKLVGDAEDEKAADEAEKTLEEEIEAHSGTVLITDGYFPSDGSGGPYGGFLTVAEFKPMGAMYWNGYRYTWYSETVLPGTGLSIPSRGVSNGAVVDGDGYVCLASEDFPKGTVLNTPIGVGKVYDSGCAHGTIDIYVH